MHEDSFLKNRSVHALKYVVRLVTGPFLQEGVNLLQRGWQLKFEIERFIQLIHGMRYFIYFYFVYSSVHYYSNCEESIVYTEKFVLL